MPEGTKLIDIGEKPSEVSPKNEKYYPSIRIPVDKLPSLKGKEVGEKVAFYGMGSIRSIDEDGVSVEVRQVGDVRQLTEKEYLAKTDDEKDDIDSKDLEQKNSAHKEE